eukprot:GEMP01056923.1.p1 GENE.GEMP01056923.1~~GEMP01056923.1.p1  ORF type:complete len:187 (+),score=53.16 GEMP01056923.1:362-922(+)
MPAKIEEITSDPEINDVDSDSTDDEMPTLENADKDNAAPESGHKQNRSEKKGRKALQKMGIKPVSGIIRVTIKKSNTILFVIAKPDVHKAPGSDTYIVFGEAKIEDQSAKAQATAAQQFTQPAVASAETKIEEIVIEPEVEVDETGIEPKDIELVIAQAGCTRAKAVQALKTHNNDLVEAIMELSG